MPANVTPGQPYRWLTLDQAADYLGATPRQVRRWALAGQLPSFRPGRALAFLASDLDEFIVAARREAVTGPLAERRATQNN